MTTELDHGSHSGIRAIHRYVKAEQAASLLRLREMVPRLGRDRKEQEAEDGRGQGECGDVCVGWCNTRVETGERSVETSMVL